MGLVTAAIYERLANDATLASMLATYNGAPAVFTVVPVPGDAQLPYIVTAGDAVRRPYEAKNRPGWEIWRDVRCYADTNGSAVQVEAIAERVVALLHRVPLEIEGFGVLVGDCTGPISADEETAYGRVVTVRLIMLMEA